jgi:hypothetical protein
MIPDPREQPTISVEEAAHILGLGRTVAYMQANRFLATDGAEGIPALRFGRTLRVPTARLVALLEGQPDDLSVDEVARGRAVLG